MQCGNASSNFDEHYKFEKLRLPNYSFKCRGKKKNIRYSVYNDPQKNFYVYDGKIWCKESEIFIKSIFNCQGECIETLDVIYNSNPTRIFEIQGNKLGGGISDIELDAQGFLLWKQNLPDLVVSFNDCMLDFETGIVRCEE